MFLEKNKIFTVVSAIAVCIGLSASVVYAGAMPDAKPPAEEMTPLDEALMDIQNIGTKGEAPVSLAPQNSTPEQIIESVKAVEPIAVVSEPEPEVVAIKAVVPENRIVQIQPDSAFFGLSVGLYDVATHDKLATAFNFEYQPGMKILGILQPIFGAMLTTQGTLFGYGGVGVPMDIGEKVFLMPSVAVGSYHKGDGYDLGKSLAYRVGAELGYKLENQSRISLNAHIITNGESLGREDRTEVIGITYTTPLQKFSKNKDVAERPY